MRKILFLLFLTAASAVYSWNVNPVSLRERAAKEIPGWMKQRITEDLLFFAPSSVTAISIAETLSAVTSAQGGEAAALVRVRMRHGFQEWESPLNLNKNEITRLESFLEGLRLLDSILPLPDLDFLVSLADHYDRPLFLRFTKAPVFTVSKSIGNRKSIMFPKGLWNSEREVLFERICKSSELYPWEFRYPQAFWRGSLSEGFYPYFEWDFKPRPRLVFFSRHNPDLLDAGFIQNQYLTQFHHLWQKWMDDNGFIKNEVSPEEQVAFQYLVAIDGAASPGSLVWQMFSQSTILKEVSSQKEWFYDALEPGVHYALFRNDSSDLKEVITSLRQNPRIAENMARKAKEFAEEFLRDEGVFLFMYHLLQAYSSLL